MSDHDAAPIDLEELHFEPLADRPSKVYLGDLGRPSRGRRDGRGPARRPAEPAGRPRLEALRDAIVRARVDGRPVVAALGGHVIKTGCAPYLNDWVERGVLNGLALNGSAAIHDLELAIAGKTSEDVGPRLMAGTFGFARETSELFARACRRAVGRVDRPGGRAGRRGDRARRAGARREPAGGRASPRDPVDGPRRDRDRHRPHDLASSMAPALGASSLADFRTLCDLVARMAGGVWLNLGSAVVLPEVFLKAVAVARNLGRSLDGLTTANLDFEQKYRGLLNVLQRPGSEGIALTGHHELMIPLLHAAVAERIRGGRRAVAEHSMTIVVFCPNLIGDTVMATPTLRALRLGFPDATDPRRHQASRLAHARWRPLARRPHPLRPQGARPGSWHAVPS